MIIPVLAVLILGTIGIVSNSYSESVTDPAGDVLYPNADVIGVDAFASNTDLTFTLTFADVPSMPNISGIQIWIDSDQNINTTNLPGTQFCGLGPEFKLSLAGLSQFRFFVGFGNANLIFTGDTVFSGNSLTYVIPLSILSDDGIVNFSVSVTSTDVNFTYVDHVPDDTSTNCTFLTSTIVLPPLPEEQTQNLIEDVEDLLDDETLNKGNSNALIKKLEGVIKNIEQGDTDGACDKLGAFINQVEAFFNSGKLSQSQSDDLISAATEIKDTIPC